MIRLPDGFYTRPMLRCNRATAGPPVTTSPPRSFHRNQVSNNAAPATASASLNLPLQLLLSLNQFRFISVSVAKGGRGGGVVGEGGGLGQGKGNRDVWFSSNPLKHAHTIKCPNQKVEKVVQKLCLFLFFAPFKCDISKVKTCLSILSGS